HRGVARQIEHAALYLQERLVGHVDGATRRAMRHAQDAVAHRGTQVRHRTAQQIEQASARVADAHAAIRTDASLRKLEHASGRLDALADQIARRARMRCTVAARELRLASNVVRVSDPSRWLQRGYAIVRNAAG